MVVLDAVRTAGKKTGSKNLDAARTWISTNINTKTSALPRKLQEEIRKIQNDSKAADGTAVALAGSGASAEPPTKKKKLMVTVSDA